ncbi:hypothetical protein [Streptosporangium sp. NPDC000396]|uniref:hypothetical protein n=1 Tax=Streptosporangium sp. NPDC000396 TaxID=3366185 RepID=UPI0036C6866C
MSTARRLHAQLHLLDRQVVHARDGRLICKVDDLELESEPDGRPYISAILAGPLALGPRIGGTVGRMMVAVTELLRPEERPEPPRIPMALVSEIGSAITAGGELEELTLERWTRDNIIAPIPGSGQIEPREPGNPPERGSPDATRLSGLIGVTVTDAEGRIVGQVADLQFSQEGPLLGGVQYAFRIEGLVVVPRHTGQLFGYERGPGGRAPWLVRSVIRWLHSGSRFVTWDQVASLGGDEIRLSVPAAELLALRELYERER